MRWLERGRAQDIAGGAENAIAVLMDHQWTYDPTEKSRRGQAGGREPEWHAKDAGLYH